LKLVKEAMGQKWTPDLKDAWQTFFMEVDSRIRG
jgi:hypothetical protein